MKAFRIKATRVARRLARKLARPAALWIVERQLRSSEVQAQRFTRRGVTVPIARSLARKERQRQVGLIARRNLIREW